MDVEGSALIQLACKRKSKETWPGVESELEDNPKCYKVLLAIEEARIQQMQLYLWRINSVRQCCNPNNKAFRIGI
jgi:hypothetical protein